MELFRLENPLRSLSPAVPRPPLLQVPHPEGFEIPPGWGFHPCPELKNPFQEGILPDIQPNPSWHYLRPFPLFPLDEWAKVGPGAQIHEERSRDEPRMCQPRCCRWDGQGGVPGKRGGCHQLCQLLSPSRCCCGTRRALRAQPLPEGSCSSRSFSKERAAQNEELPKS